MRKNTSEAGSKSLFEQPSIESIARRIRALRKERGWSLGEVEKLSRGKIKAVVLGSYERGDRSLSVKRAIELANFFGVPLTHLLAPTNSGQEASPYLVIDIRRVKHLSGSEDEKVRLFTAFVSRIVNQRRDWNGEVLSLRQSDLSILGLLLGSTERETLTWMEKNKLLFITPSRP